MKRHHFISISFIFLFISQPLRAQITYSAPSSPSQTVARLGTYLEEWSQSRDFCSASKNIESLCNGTRTIKVSDKLMSSIVRENPLLSAASAGELFQLGNYLTGIHKRIRKGYKFSISNISEEHGLLKTGEDKNLSFVKFDINILSPNNKKETCRDIAYVRDNQITGIYRYELGKERNIENLYDKANHGDVVAQYNVAKLLLEGESKDSIEAATYLLVSASGAAAWPTQPRFDAENANIEAEYKLASLCQNVNSQYKGWFYAMLGCLYEGQYKFQKAEQYYKYAIRLGEDFACAKLGHMYWMVWANSMREIISVSVDDECKKGILEVESFWYDDNGYNASMDYLRTKTWDEDDNIPKWLELAVEKGEGGCEFGIMPYTTYDLLLFAYIDGIGTPINYSKAIDLIEKYCMQNHIDDIDDLDSSTITGCNVRNALIILDCIKTNE